jgi:hypothetical protein
MLEVGAGGFRYSQVGPGAALLGYLAGPLPGCDAPLGCELLHPGGGGGWLGWWRRHHDELGHADPGELGEHAGAAVGQRHGHGQVARVPAAPLFS